jgi:hypothetical protein
VFCYTSWRFYAFFGTNLLTRCHSASSLFSVVFCVSEKLHRKYSRNWMKQKPKSPKQRLRGASRQLHHKVARPTPDPRHQVVWSPSPPPDISLLPIYSHRRESPKSPINFPKKLLQATAVINARLGGSRSSSRHPAGEGNHHWRPSSSPCLPPE